MNATNWKNRDVVMISIPRNNLPSNIRCPSFADNTAAGGHVGRDWCRTPQLGEWRSHSNWLDRLRPVAENSDWAESNRPPL